MKNMEQIVNCIIPLSQNKFAIVSECDFEWLNQWKWHAHREGATNYAYRSVHTENGRLRFSMHRQILGAPPDMQVDHKNHNGLDNRRANIRLCTLTENRRNRKPQGGSSKFKGVYWYYDKSRNSGKWRARIRVNGKRIFLGCFHEETGAAKAYDAAANKYFGEFAYVNFRERSN